MKFRQHYPEWRIPDTNVVSGECSFEELMSLFWVKNREGIPGFRGWRQRKVREDQYLLIGAFETKRGMDPVCIAFVWDQALDMETLKAYDKDEIFEISITKKKRAREKADAGTL